MNHTSAPKPLGALDAPIIVHSHLRWDFVWQRPQQLLSRFAARVPVLFVEEPVYTDGAEPPHFDLSHPTTNVCRAVPVLPAALRQSYDQSITATRELLRRELCADGRLGTRYERPVQWFYTPMPAPAMIGAFGERAVVYDCMDELANFRFAPPELVDREKLLISEADVIFVGGLKLAQSKGAMHSNVHFFGCGVDSVHFGSGMQLDSAAPGRFDPSTDKVVGYYGVIDERVDYELLHRLAVALPDVAIVMIGPVVKVAPDELPRDINIHWVGQRSYADLPAYVRDFDVCLMPFALNDATAYINPTKTLEYMAAGKPIVSTAIADVVRQFASTVYIANSHDEFIARVSDAIATPDPRRIAAGLETARQHSWENIVAQMQAIIATSIHSRESADADKWRAPSRSTSRSSSLAGSRDTARTSRTIQRPEANPSGSATPNSTL